MSVTIATMRAAGLSAEQIVRVLETEENERVARRREQNRINKKKQRSRQQKRDDVDDVDDVDDAADKADPSPQVSPLNGSPTPPPIITPSSPPSVSVLRTADDDGEIPGFLKREEPRVITTEETRDIRADLFGRGLKTLAMITGKTPDSCRSLVGKWLKSVNDEAIHVLGAIDDAERNRVADPVAWINRALQPHTGNRNGKLTVHDAAANLTQRLRSLDEPAPDLREREGGSAVRQLPAR